MSEKPENPEFVKLACAEAKKLGDADRKTIAVSMKTLKVLSEHYDESYLGFFQDKYMELAGKHAQSVKAAIVVNNVICKSVLVGERRSHKGVYSVVSCALICRTRDNLNKALKAQGVRHA